MSESLAGLERRFSVRISPSGGAVAVPFDGASIHIAFRHGDEHYCNESDYWRGVVIEETGECIGQLAAVKSADGDVKWQGTDYRHKEIGDYYFTPRDVALELFSRWMRREECKLVAVGEFDAQPGVEK